MFCSRRPSARLMGTFRPCWMEIWDKDSTASTSDCWPGPIRQPELAVEASFVRMSTVDGSPFTAALFELSTDVIAGSSVSKSSLLLSEHLNWCAFLKIGQGKHFSISFLSKIVIHTLCALRQLWCLLCTTPILLNMRSVTAEFDKC